MVRTFLIVIFFLFSTISFSQNVGQKSDDTSVWNYTDINGMKQGKWLKFNNTKKYKLYEGFFLNNRPVGEFKRYYKNGKYSAILFYLKDSEKIKAKLYWDTGILAAEGNYSKENTKDSIWNYYGVDKALIAKEEYINGLKNGMSTKYFRVKDKSGVQIKSEEIGYKNNVRDGIWKQYFENGRIKLETTYSNDTVNGTYSFNKESGEMYCFGFYKKGLKEGEWNFKDDSGKKYIIKYKKGIALNADEISKKFGEDLKKLEEEGKKLNDPDKMKNAPEQYFMGQ